MVCLCCLQWSGASVCVDCQHSFQPGRPRLLGQALVVRPAFEHAGGARELVRLLKYQGVGRATRPLAAAMTRLVPNGATVLIPVPRSHLRRLRYGVDPGLELAAELSRRTGLRMLGLLEPAWWRPPRAGKRRTARGRVGFIARAAAPAGAVLVDDVVTTGGTLLVAWEAIGRPPLGAVTATGAGV